MPTRWKLTVGWMAVVALCAGLWAQAQNAPKTNKPPAFKAVQKKVEEIKTEKTEKVEKPIPKTEKPAAAAKQPAAEKPATTTEKAHTEKLKDAAKDKEHDHEHAAAAEESPEEKEIRASAEAFTELYNKHDAAGLAALFAEKAEMVDEDGKLVKGREEIEAEFKQQFEDEPDCRMQVDVASIRVLTPHLALEEGVARCAPNADDPEAITNYVCVHVKIDDKWMLASVSDFAPVAENLTPHEHLQELSWLIGEWIDESSDSNVHSICDWDESGNFLVYHFQANVAGQEAMFGTTRIGWDAVSKQFRSWVFDSEGGFSEGSWIPADDEWIVKMKGATPDGETCSSTNVYRLVNNDTITFRSYDRIVDGELTPDIDEIVIKRQPALPSDGDDDSAQVPEPSDDKDEKKEEKTEKSE